MCQLDLIKRKDNITLYVGEGNCGDLKRKAKCAPLSETCTQDALR